MFYFIFLYEFWLSDFRVLALKVRHFLVDQLLALLRLHQVHLHLVTAR